MLLGDYTQQKQVGWEVIFSEHGFAGFGARKPRRELEGSALNFFCFTYSPKSAMNLHWLFNMSYINTNFDMFFKNYSMYGCYIFVGICLEA